MNKPTEEKYDPENFSLPEYTYKSFEANTLNNLESQINFFCMELNTKYRIAETKFQTATKVSQDGSTYISFTALICLKLKE